MELKKLKKEYNLTNRDLAEVFELSENSYKNSSAKPRYERAAIKFEKIFTKNQRRLKDGNA